MKFVILNASFGEPEILIRILDRDSGLYFGTMLTSDGELLQVKGISFGDKNWRKFEAKPAKVDGNDVGWMAVAPPIVAGQSVRLSVQFSQRDASGERHICALEEDGTQIPNDTFEDSNNTGLFNGRATMKVT